jgi:LysR family hydrogen peroxide-inducible transcriptional activator
LTKSFSLTQLNYILALNDTQHFGLAAKKVHISQPTLSLQIQKLEDELGTAIFDRSKQPIIPTDMGQKIIEQVRKILDEARVLESIVGEQSEVQGTFRLGIIPTLATDVLKRFLPALLERFPRLQLNVRETVTEEIVEFLKRDELDAGLLVTPLHDAGLQEFPLFYEPLWLYFPKGHPLLKSKIIEKSDLEREDLMLLSEGHCFRAQMLEVCRHRKPKRDARFQFESGSFESLLSLVDKGLGYTILPQLAAERLIKDKSRVRPFADPAPVREVSLVRSRLFAKKRIADAIASLIQNEIRSDLQVRPAKHSIVPIKYQ